MIRIFTDERCLLHGAPPGYPEVPARLEQVTARLLRRFEAAPVAPAQDLEGSVLAIHDESYIERFRRAAERGDGLLDSADNPLSESTWTAAWAAVEAVLRAADWVAGAPDRRAFAAVRPPGHHAERARAMGFCFFNNIAVAAERLRQRHGLERVAIFDFDVHHGNSTQHSFEERADVFYASTHQHPFYPGTGAAGERGRGAGVEATLNVPLAAGTGDEGYAAAVGAQVLPALAAHRPQALLLSAGFDAWRDDPLGGMRVTEEGFADWGRRLAALAAEACDGRVLAVLEGGYDVDRLGELAEAFVTGLADRAPATD